MPLKSRTIFTAAIALLFLLPLEKAHSACNLANGNQVIVRIKTPSRDAQLVIRQPGAVLQNCTSENSGQDNTKLEWTINGVLSGKLKFSEGHIATGTSATLLAPTSWPAWDDYGLEMLQLYYMAPLSQDQDPLERLSDCRHLLPIYIFFERNATVNGAPAWFHYWSPVIDETNYLPPLTFAGESALLEATYHFEQNICRIYGDSEDERDINRYARVIAHENIHAKIMTEFWG
ncbi:MAG: hypothetical protein JXR40_02870 [Pontiellaceae bacterium]|nr:hypothetical protein [Pontiellaceae bacterium]